ETSVEREPRGPLARRGAVRAPLDVRDALRRPGPDQSDAAALPLGHRGSDPPGRERGVPAGEPRRPDLPARAATGGDRVGRRRERGDRGRRRGGRRMSEVSVVAERPTPGEPRPYDFPDVARSRLATGLAVVVAALPGRPLVSATLVLRNGAVDEPDADGGATVLAARSLTEG